MKEYKSETVEDTGLELEKRLNELSKDGWMYRSHQLVRRINEDIFIYSLIMERDVQK